MKTCGGLILLATLFCSVLSPLTFHLPAAPDGAAACLATLDVCHASGSPAAVSADMPFYCEGHADLARFETTSPYGLQVFVAVPFPSPSPEEHPPRA